MSAKRIVAFLACLCIGTSSLFGQVTVSLSSGIGSPMVEYLGSSYQLQAGGYYRAFKRIDIGLNVGYQTFSDSRPEYQSKVIPLSLEAMFHFSDDGVDPYFLLQAGISHVEYQYDEVYRSPIDFGTYQTASIKQLFHDNKPMYGLGAGLLFPITSVLSIDLSFHLTVVESRLEMQRVSDVWGLIDSPIRSSWSYSQWSGGVRWSL
jgi:hypothetical protein